MINLRLLSASFGGLMSPLLVLMIDKVKERRKLVVADFEEVAEAHASTTAHVASERLVGGRAVLLVIEIGLSGVEISGRLGRGVGGGCHGCGRVRVDH